MKLIDIRETTYGKVADVKLDNADLSFSMPYVEFALLEKCGQLDNDGAAIESNIRFMSKIRNGELTPKVARFMGPLEPPADYRIFNQKQADGTYPPLSKFFDDAVAKADAGKTEADQEPLSQMPIMDDMTDYLDLKSTQEDARY